MDRYEQKELVLTGVKIFSSDGKLPDEKTISDTAVFFKEDLTYIGIELGFSPSESSRQALITWHIYDGSGRDISKKIQATVQLSPGMDRIYHSWGYPEKNRWSVGKHRISVSLDQGTPMSKDFQIKTRTTSTENGPLPPVLKYLLLTLLALFCFPLFMLYLARDSIKEWFWETAKSGSGVPADLPSDTRYPENDANGHSEEVPSGSYTFCDGKGYLRYSGGAFYDSKGILREWGQSFYDGRGIYCEWGSPFHDSRGNYCPWGSSFHDSQGNLIVPD